MKRAVLLIALLATAAAGAKPFSYESKTRYAEVDFAYSAEAAAVPALVKRFKSDLARERTQSIACGKAETEVRVKSGSEGIACSSSTGITTSGQTARLLSLARAYYAFTGGAHGNGGTTPLLWDRRLGKEISSLRFSRRPTPMRVSSAIPIAGRSTRSGKSGADPITSRVRWFRNSTPVPNSPNCP